MKINFDKVIRITVLSAIIIYTIIGYPRYEPLPQATVFLMSQILSLYLGYVPPIDDNRMVVALNDNRDYGFLTSPECSGVLVMMVFLFVVFITPGLKLRHRFYSLIFLPLLFVINSFRVVSGIIFSDLTTMNNLSTYHATVGQIIMFLSMVSIYIMFLKIFGYFKKGRLDMVTMGESKKI